MKASCIALLLSLVASALLTGCGQKGPLFLPGEAPESQTDGPFGMNSSDDDQASRPAPQGAGNADDPDNDSR